MSASLAQPTLSRADVLLYRGLTILFLGAIAWITWHTIPIVTDIDGTFSRMALRAADSSETRRLADHASSQGAILVRYRFLFAAVAVGLPVAALLATFLRPSRRVIILCLLFLTGTCIFCFSLIAIITST